MQKKARRAAGASATDSLAPQYPIESVDKALRLLLLLGEQPEIRLTEATRYLGVASSTAHRLLAMLAYRGFVRQDPVSKAYLPGPALTGVAFAIFGRIDIAGTVTPIMRSLSERLRETVHVGMLDGAAVPDGALAKALNVAMTAAADQTFRDVVREAITNRDAINAWVTGAGDVAVGPGQFGAGDRRTDDLALGGAEVAQGGVGRVGGGGGGQEQGETAQDRRQGQACS